MGSAEVGDEEETPESRRLWLLTPPLYLHAHLTLHDANMGTEGRGPHCGGSAPALFLSAGIRRLTSGDGSGRTEKEAMSINP